jgi:hypothetical protein
VLLESLLLESESEDDEDELGGSQPSLARATWVAPSTDAPAKSATVMANDLIGAPPPS